MLHGSANVGFERAIQGVGRTSQAASGRSGPVRGKSRIPAGQDRFSDRPLNVEGGIVPAEPRGALRGKPIGHLVEDIRSVQQRLEAVGDPVWDVERTAIAFLQLNPEPLEMAGGVLAQVQGDVEHGSAHARDQLGLFVRGTLEMHSSQGPRPAIARDAALHQLGSEPVLGEFFRTPDPAKGAARVFVGITLHDDDAFKRSRCEPHR